jgi:hypothetical protein
MTKEADFASAVDFAKRNAGSVAGAVGGALYGGYRGTQGPEAGVGSTVLGAASGALGGGLIGHVAHHGGRALIGQKNEPNLFKQISEAGAEARQAAKDHLGDEARHGLFADTRNIRAYRESPEYVKIKNDMAEVDNKAMSGLIPAAEARAQIDTLATKDPVHNHERLKKQLVWGSLGAASALGTGAGLLRNAGAGAESPDEEIRQSLLQKYQQTGQLDPRQMMLLNEKLRGDSSSV